MGAGRARGAAGLQSAAIGATVTLGLAIGVGGAGLRAQQPSGQVPVPGAPAIGVRVEQRAERFDYHFENPSNFEPGPPVPHAIDQRYEADNTWLFFNAAYRLLGLDAFTEFGLTPRITTPGSDIDTFYQPSGDVITSGTRGDVRMSAFSVQQRLDLASWRAWTFGVAIAYRRSTMDYLPSDRIVTHTQPQSETREPVAGHETTWSHVLQSGLTAAAPLKRTERWFVGATVDAYPISRARLNVSLPEKYPGDVVSGDTFGFGLYPRLVVERRYDALTVGAGLKAARVWGYRDSSNYTERQLGIDVYLRIPID
jgi:hypothetical protein